ncbi:hypothetical protein PLICRDRAFT_51194 [Plicaturopsis crispa FD-325 SS-3]|nr:hypothetical protein PLICRDRAFT_51194 [Plicaturopsis crispa FD-325 SS-3]
MIRSLGRSHGVVERSLTARRTTSVLSTVALRAAVGRPVGPLACGPSSRWLSGPAAPHTRDSSAPKASPAPPPARKPKVELRPGPVKPKHDPSDASTSASSTKHAAPETRSSLPKLADTQSSETKAAPASNETITEITKHDIEDAAQHGILAPVPADAGRIGALFHQAKELFKFYWRGLKLISANRKSANEIRARVKAGGEPLTRWETRFISKTNEDLLKLIPFLIVVIILEEIIPLIALYAPWMLPSTCLLPSQRERIEAKKQDKQMEAREKFRSTYLDLRRVAAGAGFVPVKSLTQASFAESLCGAMQLSTMGPTPLRIRRIERHLLKIAADDELLRRETFGVRLSHRELLEALQERGIVTKGLAPSELPGLLKLWLESVDKIEAGDVVSRRILAVAECVR